MRSRLFPDHTFSDFRGNVSTPRKTTAPGVLLKSFFSDFLSPSKIASMNVNWEKDYGMDNEVLRVFEEANRFANEERKFVPFAWFKLFDRYLAIPELLALVGCVQVPEIISESPRLQSKTEKLRNEVCKAQLKIKQRPNPDTNILAILDYILETTMQYRHFELVAYDVRDGEVETLIDKLLNVVPKVDGRGHPGPQKHIVSVQRKLWPERGYVISDKVYENFPQLKPFFASPTGEKFYASFMEYLASHFPNMQDKMLDHVNSFTNRYFQWMSVCVFMTTCAPFDVAWKYIPDATPLFFTPGMPIQKMILRIFSSKEDGVVKRQFFFLDEVRFVLHQLTRMGVSTNGVSLTPFPLEGPSPVIHRFAEIGSVDYMVELLRNIFPRFVEVVDIVNVDIFSSSMTDSMAFPVMSPFNSHCVRSRDVFKRLVDILVGEVGVGRRIPFTFHPFVTLMKKMEKMFLGDTMYKQMVNRKDAYELIQEAADMRGKFNGKLKTPKGRLGLLSPDATDVERMSVFLATFRRFARFHDRHLESPIPEGVLHSVPPGEPSLVAIHNYLIYGIEQEDDGEIV